MNRGTCPRDRRRVPDDDVEIGLTQGYNDEPSLEPLKNLVKKDKGNITSKKARLVVQGHDQEKGIGYDEYFASVARMGVYVQPPLRLRAMSSPVMTKKLCNEFAKLKGSEFEMSMKGVLNFFYGRLDIVFSFGLCARFQSCPKESCESSKDNTKEAVAGKCNVVCISEDNRNPQPSDEEVKAADYVFYRVFDVGNCTILDKMYDKIGGLDVKYVFNRQESQKGSHVLKLASDQKDDKTAMENQANGESDGLKPQNSPGTAKASNLIGKSDVQSSLVRQDVLQRDTNVLRVNQATAKKGNSIPGEKNSHDLGVAKPAGKSGHLAGRSDVDAQSSPIRGDALHGDANDSHIELQPTMKGNPAPVLTVNRNTDTTVVHMQNTISEENARFIDKNDKDDGKVNKPPVKLVEAGERGKPPKNLGILDGMPSKRIKVNGSETISDDKGGNSVQNSSVCRNDKKIMGSSDAPSDERKKSDSKLSGGLDKNVKIRKDGAALDIRPPKKTNIDSHKVKQDSDKNISISKRVDSIDKLPKLSAGTSAKEVERTEGKSFEVNRRPVVVSFAPSNVVFFRSLFVA
ncbi:putative phosphatidylinositol/phosphatidylcholine transfer protein SFH1-like isoform X1 [Capsicum annuum]|nr:putative phosphatidylinositol/phosphatidylcholine transfer protein SFH1-like isoform X1 [Capsicum annuum]